MGRPAFVSSAAKGTKGKTTLRETQDDNHNDDDIQLLKNWVSHSDLSFHEFDPEKAAEIQQCLLSWYYKNRRKLPWRGDPPPYDGSTAGINTSHPKSKKKTQEKEESTVSTTTTTTRSMRKAKQNPSQKITSFFPPTKKAKIVEATKSPTVETTTDTSTTTTVSTSGIPISAYGVWVSEIMLQQTRVEAVIPFWIRWMESFPTVHDLAFATEDQVNSHWAGLGFYRRAKLLHQGAQFVVKEYDGKLPETVNGLLKITGIGPYTASAIASIVFHVPVPVVDGNVCRVLSRLTGIANHIKAPILKDKLGWDLATQLIQDSKHPGDINQALMELGATYCSPSGTGLDPRDPLKEFYFSTRIAKGYHSLLKRRGEDCSNLVSLAKSSCPICDQDGVQTILERLEESIHAEMSEDEAMRIGHTIFPMDPPKKARREEDLMVGVISTRYENELWWLLIRRPFKGLLAGQWEFPSICVKRSEEGQSDSPKKRQRKSSSSSPKSVEHGKTLTEFLEMILENGEPKWSPIDYERKLLQSTPLEHIFSHVKHNMWLETVTIDAPASALHVKEWITDEGREVRWMRDCDMKEVGITSGVKKILNTVKAKDLKE